jgi:hypothetical protein
MASTSGRLAHVICTHQCTHSTVHVTQQFWWPSAQPLRLVHSAQNTVRSVVAGSQNLLSLAVNTGRVADPAGGQGAGREGH